MPADHRRFIRCSQLEPGLVARRRVLTLGVEIHTTFARAKAKARHSVHDDPKPVPAGERVVPLLGAAAVHVGEKLAIAGRGEGAFYLARELEGFADAPLRHETGMNHGVAA